MSVTRMCQKIDTHPRVSTEKYKARFVLAGLWRGFAGC